MLVHYPANLNALHGYAEALSQSGQLLQATEIQHKALSVAIEKGQRYEDKHREYLEQYQQAYKLSAN